MQVRPIYVLGVLAVLSSLTLADTPEDSPAPPQHESAMQLFAVELSDDPHTYAAQRQRLRDDVVMQQAALVAILEGRFALVSSSMPVTLPGFEGAWQVASSHVADPPDEIQKSDPVVAKLWEILMELPPDELSGDIDDGDCGTSSEDEVVGLEETDPLEAWINTPRAGMPVRPGPVAAFVAHPTFAELDAETRTVALLLARERATDGSKPYASYDGGHEDGPGDPEDEGHLDPQGDDDDEPPPDDDDTPPADDDDVIDDDDDSTPPRWVDLIATEMPHWDPEDGVVAVSGPGSCVSRVAESDDWPATWEELSANDDELARELMDWGRFSPNTRWWTGSQRAGLSEYAGGFHRFITVVARGEDDWQDNWSEQFLAAAAVAASALHWPSIYDGDYVHFPTADVTTIYADVSGAEYTARVQDMALGADDDHGPWNLPWEEAVFDALEAELGTPGWTDFRDANPTRCLHEERRFDCLLQWRRMVFWEDFVHLGYVVDRYDGDSGITGIREDMTWKGVSKVLRPYYILLWNRDVIELERMIRVSSHEQGHNLGALDEYSGAENECDRRSGYLQIETANSQHVEDEGDEPCDEQQCLMRGSGSTEEPIGSLPFCGWSRGQVGQADDDAWSRLNPWNGGGDCVYDPHDSDPASYLRIRPHLTVEVEHALPDDFEQSPDDSLGVYVGWASFEGDDAIDQAEQYIADNQLFEDGLFWRASVVSTFPGFAFDCGVPKVAFPDWSITINEIEDVQFRYVGAANPVPNPWDVAWDRLDGNWHAARRIPVEGPFDAGYALERMAVVVRVDAIVVTLEDGMGGMSDPWLMWPANPDLDARDFEVRVATDTGNTSDGGTTLDSGQLDRCD